MALTRFGKGSASGSGSNGSAAASPWPWLVTGLKNITQYWKQNGELGVDLGLPMGTPITSLTAGQVLGSGYFSGGGVVSIRTLINGKSSSLYYQHLDEIAGGIIPGAVVAPGQLLGWSGGQLSGGHHPASPATSTGPHMEVGINAPIKATPDLWHPLGPNIDPLPFLTAVASGKTNPGGTVIGQVNQQMLGHIPGFVVVCQALDQVCQFEPWAPPSSVVAAPANAGNPVSQIGADMQAMGTTTGRSISYGIGWGVGNLRAFVARSIFVGLGWVLLLLVLWNLIRSVNNVVIMPTAEAAGAVAGFADNPAGQVTRAVARGRSRGL